MTHMTDRPIASTPIAATPSCPGAPAGKPFARIILGDLIYEVADRDTETGTLAFRNVESGPWRCLERSIEDGWSRIGADIVQSDPESLRHFMLTHAVRLDGWYRPGSDISFDTLGTTWHVRCPEQGPVEVVLGDEAPRRVDPAVAQSDDLREQAIEVLLAAYPDLGARFAAEIDHWAVRLAAGASVTPVF